MDCKAPNTLSAGNRAAVLSHRPGIGPFDTIHSPLLLVTLRAVASPSVTSRLQIFASRNRRIANGVAQSKNVGQVFFSASRSLSADDDLLRFEKRARSHYPLHRRERFRLEQWHEHYDPVVARTGDAELHRNLRFLYSSSRR